MQSLQSDQGNPSNKGSQKALTIARRVLLGISWFNGILAPIFGILMMVFPSGEQLMMESILATMQTWPGAELFFQSLFWPGFALLCVNGVSNIGCLIFWRLKYPSYTVIGIICGLLLIAWCSWEIVFLPNEVTTFYFILGIIQTAAAVYCTAKR